MGNNAWTDPKKWGCCFKLLFAVFAIMFFLAGNWDFAICTVILYIIGHVFVKFVKKSNVKSTQKSDSAKTSYYNTASRNIQSYKTYNSQSKAINKQGNIDIHSQYSSEIRLQILNESLSIIDKTKNIDTLNSRYKEACEQIDWMYSNGVKLSNKTKEECRIMVDDNKNENITRIAKLIHDEYKTKIENLKTQKGKDNAHERLECSLSECLSSIVDSPNKDKYVNEILSIISIGNERNPNNQVEANRYSDIKRWNDMDFVVGYEIKLSNKKLHCDICEQLAGKYPKSFKWSGWYDGCSCYIVPILKTEDEFWDFNEGNEPATKSVNEVVDVPDNFKQWVVENKDLIKKYEDEGTLPNFIADNKRIIDKILLDNK